MRTAIPLILTAIIAFPLAADDFRIVQEVESSGIPGQSGTSQQVVLLSGEKVRVEMPNQVMILRADRGVVYMLDTRNSSYFELTVDDFRSMAAAAGASLAGMMGDSELEVTGRTRTIGEWQAREVRIVQKLEGVGEMQIEAWMSEDVDPGLKVLTEFAQALNPFAAMNRKLLDLGGLPVETTLRLSVMGQEVMSRTRLVSVVKEAQAPGAFEVPKGWTKQEAPVAAGMGRQ